jgi:hypothetical protein
VSEKTGKRLTDLAYVAGVIDGEGSIAYRTTPCVRVEVTSREIVEKLYETLGGTCSVAKRRTRSNKLVFTWGIYGQNALRALDEISEFLIEKRNQAILVSKVQRYPPRSAMREWLMDRIRADKECRYD